MNGIEKTSKFVGVSYRKRDSVWRASRRSKNEKRSIWNGTYSDEETAAHASDTLARKLIANGEQAHKLNFLDDDTDVYPKEVTERLCRIITKNPLNFILSAQAKEKDPIMKI